MTGHGTVKFLGTAGARFVVARQLRYSAGTHIRLADQSIILDPGPGTLLRMAKSRPSIDAAKLSAVILSHLHIDHSTDVNAVIDAMTAGGFDRRGVLFAPRQSLEGEDAVVLRYLRGHLDEVVNLEPASEYELGELSFVTSIPHDHGCETYGIRLRHEGLTLSFMVDTRFFPELIQDYAGSDVLIMNVVRLEPHSSGEILHLCVDDARRILADIQPRKAILTHFGMTMIRAKPWVVAERLSDDLGLEVIAASDGMTLEL